MLLPPPPPLPRRRPRLHREFELARPHVPVTPPVTKVDPAVASIGQVPRRPVCIIRRRKKAVSFLLPSFLAGAESTDEGGRTRAGGCYRDGSDGTGPPHPSASVRRSVRPPPPPGRPRGGSERAVLLHPVGQGTVGNSGASREYRAMPPVNRPVFMNYDDRFRLHGLKILHNCKFKESYFDGCQREANSRSN